MPIHFHTQRLLVPSSRRSRARRLGFFVIRLGRRWSAGHGPVVTLEGPSQRDRTPCDGLFCCGKAVGTPYACQQAEAGHIPLSEADLGESVYWVYHTDLHRSAKVHKATCSMCNNGQGKLGGKAKNGDWHGCPTLDDALRLAETLEPDNNAICKMCLGSYRNSGYRGPRGPRRSRPLLN